MHDLVERSDVSSKLKKEAENLSLLKESLAKSERMKESMLAILNSFEKRLTKLEDTIMPIYQETGNLQRRHENIEQTITCLDQAIGYYNVAEEVEPVMKDGPGSNLSAYIEGLNRLSKASAYLIQNSQGSSAMGHVVALYEAGKELLEKEFHNLLSHHGKPASPNVLIELITNDNAENSPTPFQLTRLSEVPLDSLRTISLWLQGCGTETNFTVSYAKIRSDIIIKSLRDLKNHLMTIPARETAALFTVGAAPSPSMKGKLRETPRKQTRSMANRASSFLKKQQESPAYRPLNSAGADSADVDANPFIIIFPALLKLLQAEDALMRDIIPDKNRMKIFEAIVANGLEFVSKEGEQICQSVRRIPVKHNCTPAIQLLPVIRQAMHHKGRFEDTIKDCSQNTKIKFFSIYSQLQSTILKSLEEFVDCIRNDPDKHSSLPRDGTVHELTSNTMFFMEQLLEYSDVIGHVLIQDPSLQGNLDPRMKMAEYFTKILSALGLNLNNKAEVYNDGALKAIFMMNNFNYILVSLRRSGMIDIVHLWNVEVESFYEDQINNQKRIYSQSWSRVLYFISDNMKQVPSVPLDVKLKDKERNVIKEKFTGFNKELEDICKQQKIFSVPDPELRHSLLEDNKSFILPYYSSFLARYKDASFTKNPDKYLKYSVEDLAGLISGFFDTSA